ncbi:hypothetical protein L3Q82_003996 [Scortum barcoo]|uniref:Uncharacterized protein n=1 Tax=Scortum barcoo TaxID=214431 RepID=A0ACB8X7J6_9TELE|nr:hypothetical protein L3Q82_003996 [Scortum barcoo]
MNPVTEDCSPAWAETTAVAPQLGSPNAQEPPTSFSTAPDVAYLAPNNEKRPFPLQISRSILESLLSPAADVVKGLRPDLHPLSYLQLLDSAFSMVEDGEELYAQFMNTLQDPELEKHISLSLMATELSLKYSRHQSAILVTLCPETGWRPILRKSLPSKLGQFLKTCENSDPSLALLGIIGGQDLQHVLERFAAECEAAGMRISTSKSEAMVLDRTGKGWHALSRWVERSCLKWRSSSISGSCSRVRERSEREIDRRIGAASAVMRRSVYRTVVVKKELSRKGEALEFTGQSTFPPSPMVMNFG